MLKLNGKGNFGGGVNSTLFTLGYASFSVVTLIFCDLLLVTMSFFHFIFK